MKIKYEQLFPTASFLNCRIGFETDIPDDGNVDMELTHLREMAVAFHMKEFPHLYKENKPIYQGEEEQSVRNIEKVPDEVQALLDGINKCTELDGDGEFSLSTFWLRAKGNLNTSTAYKLKEKQLKDAK